VGFYISGQAALSGSAGTMRDAAFVQVGQVGPVWVFFDIKELDRITAYVNQAAAKITDLQQRK
jgi:hypothetical protein